MTNELAACPNPWCESHERPERNYAPFTNKSRCSYELAVSCPVCPMRGPWRDTEAEAIAAWNTRTPARGVDSDLIERMAQAVWGEPQYRPAGWSVGILEAARVCYSRTRTTPPADEIEAVARAMADDDGARQIAEKTNAPLFDDMEPEVQEYWRCLARAALRNAAPEIEDGS